MPGVDSFPETPFKVPDHLGQLLAPFGFPEQINDYTRLPSEEVVERFTDGIERLLGSDEGYVIKSREVGKTTVKIARGEPYIGRERFASPKLYEFGMRHILNIEGVLEDEKLGELEHTARFASGSRRLVREIDEEEAPQEEITVVDFTMVTPSIELPGGFSVDGDDQRRSVKQERERRRLFGVAITLMLSEDPSHFRLHHEAASRQ